MLADAQCIIEVLGILGVDGTGEHVAHVLAATDFLFRDARLYLLGSLLDILRIFVWQAVLRQDGVHLHIVVALLAQHVDDLPHDVLRLARGPLGDLHHRFVARLATLQLLLRDEHIVNEDVALGDEEGIVFLYLQLTYRLVHLMAQDFDHHRLLDVLLATCHIGHLHAVAIQRIHRVAFADEDGGTAVVGLERVLAVGLADKRALLHLCLQVQAVRVVADLRQIVVPRHLFHQVDRHHLDGMRIKLQRLKHLFE